MNLGLWGVKSESCGLLLSVDWTLKTTTTLISAHLLLLRNSTFQFLLLSTRLWRLLSKKSENVKTRKNRGAFKFRRSYLWNFFSCGCSSGWRKSSWKIKNWNFVADVELQKNCDCLKGASLAVGGFFEAAPTSLEEQLFWRVTKMKSLLARFVVVEQKLWKTGSRKYFFSSLSSF